MGKGYDAGLMQWQLEQAYMKGKGKAFSGKGSMGGKGKDNKGKYNGKGKNDKGKGKGKTEDWWCTEIGCEADARNFGSRSHC